MELRPPEPPLGDDAVVLREWGAADIAPVTAACQDTEIPRWTTVPAPYGEDDARAWIEAIAEARDSLHLAVVERATGALAGSISLWLIGRGIGEFGYWTVRELRGRGYMSRALRLFARWAVDELGLPRLQLGTLPGNTASERVAEKVGFLREGTLRSYLDQRGERRDVVMWSLLPGELR